MNRIYSYYNFLLQNGSTSVLYNAATDGLLVLDSNLIECIKDNKENIENLQMIHPDLYTAMLEKGMIVDATINESDAIIEKWKQEDNNPAHFFLTILPTLNCNLRCWYCYEEHMENSNMTDETMDRIIRFIDNVTKRAPELKYFHLDFFGGEPLLPFKKRVMPILQKTVAFCKERNVQLFIHFTTNGVLLTEEVRKELLSLDIPHKPGFQITLDGNRKLHDCSRYTATKQPTYDIIVKNIKGALQDGMNVNCRFNYTVNSVDTFVDVLDEFKDLTEEERNLLFFDFQQVWQESALTEVRNKAMNLAKLFTSCSQQVRIEKRYNKQRCRDDAENQASINYNGLVYKCTAFNMTEELCEGVLNEKGEIEWNERYKKRMSVKYGNSACRNCKIFPICHGGCSQTKLQALNKENCIFNYSESQRLDIIKGRIEYILCNKRTDY